MMLQLSGVHAHYGHIHALRGIDLSVQVGEVVTLIGANGAGKSTLLMSLFGQPRVSAGRIIFDGEDITRLPTHVIARRDISLVPEGRRIFPRMTVMENLLMGAVLADPRNLDVDLKRMYALFPILEERLEQRAGTLSGGEQQMLAIARALIARRTVTGPRAAVYQEDLPDHPRTERRSWHDHPAHRTERPPRPARRTSRLRHAARPDHHGRHRP